MAIDIRIDSEWDLLVQAEDDGPGTLDLLASAVLFENLDRTELQHLEEMVHIRAFYPGETIIQAGLPRSGLYIIQAGSARVMRPGPDGTSFEVGRIASGELIGEFSLLDSTPRSSAIVSAELSTLIGFFQPDLMGLIQTNPDIGFKILYRLSGMMADQLQRDVKTLRAFRKQIKDLTT